MKAETVGEAIIEIDDTDWVGDLYQHACEEARLGRALVQTPPFVADFLLERTLDPAIQTFGLDNFRFIDPACGTGHICVRAFCRLFSVWRWTRPEAQLKTAVVACLESVAGIDLDPVCVALCRTRLLRAAAEILGESNPGKVAKLHSLNVACGDSLLDGRRLSEDENPSPENPEAYRILKPGSYHAVVANPPYIRPSDPLKRDAYRARWKSCHMQFSLGVPFTELIFELAVQGGSVNQWDGEKQQLLF